MLSVIQSQITTISKLWIALRICYVYRVSLKTQHKFEFLRNSIPLSHRHLVSIMLALIDVWILPQDNTRHKQLFSFSLGLTKCTGSSMVIVLLGFKYDRILIGTVSFRCPFKTIDLDLWQDRTMFKILLSKGIDSSGTGPANKSGVYRNNVSRARGCHKP